MTFANFAIVSSEELINLVEKMPAKFAEKSQFLESQCCGFTTPFGRGGLCSRPMAVDK